MILLICNTVIKYTPTLSIFHEYYGPDNVTVTVEWTQQEGATYDVRISPLAPVLVTNGDTSHQIIVLYNTEYNLTVVAVTVCGNVTTSRTLNYGEISLTINNFMLSACVTYMLI